MGEQSGGGGGRWKPEIKCYEITASINKNYMVTNTSMVRIQAGASKLFDIRK